MTSSKKRSAKSGTKSSARRSRNGGSGASAATEQAAETANGKGHEVGSEVAISKDDAETLALYEKRMTELHRQLGQKRAEMIDFENKVAEALRKTHGEYESMVMSIAQKKGLNVGQDSGESWRYDQDTQKFTRTA